MATNDVPGANPANSDELRMGCWAESAEDGGKSLIFVYSTEKDRVIYTIFDASRDPVMEARDAMAIGEFKAKFSWRRGGNAGKWIWHDKSQFPWNRIIKAGFSDGAKYASAGDILSHAARVAEALDLRFQEDRKSVV